MSALALLLAGVALFLAFTLQSWKSKMNSFARSQPTAPDAAPPRHLAEMVARLASEMTQRSCEVSELRRQVADLQRSLEALQAIPNRSSLTRDARPSEPRYPVIDARSPETPARPPSSTAERAAAVPTRMDPAWRADLLARFREATLDPSEAGYRLMQDARIRGVEGSSAGYTLSGPAEAAKLWAAPIPGEPDSFLMLPGYSAISNWSAHFSPHRQTAAADVFGGAFDLIEGGSGLAVEAPAVVRSDGAGGLSVVQRGRLSGFRS